MQKTPHDYTSMRKREIMTSKKKSPIVVCCDCNNVIKSQCWCFGNMIDVYCTKKCLMRNSLINRIPIKTLVEDDAVMLYQEMIQNGE